MAPLIASLPNKIRKIGHWLLGIVFPIRCVGCGAYDEWLCKTCHGIIPLLTEQHCPRCSISLTPEGSVCFPCAAKHTAALDGIYVASSFTHPLLKKIIHTFKYRFVRDLGAPLALVLAQALQHSTLSTPDMIIPVPLHARRLRWRGFNQSEVLASDLNLHIMCDTTSLVRTRFTTSQVSQGKRERRLQNLKNAFHVSHPKNVKGKSILLIDDIVTTGTTLEECAKELKSAGALSVTALVLARE